MSSLKPIKIYGKRGPNPPKVAIVAEALGLPYDIEATSFEDVKKPEYLEINPNGRIPAIQDPNTGLTLWESGAIIEYLAEKYDTEHKISFAKGSHDYYLAKQWLYFQVSGQGPYYGQAAWFTLYHPEKIESAQQRYYNEIKRVTGVLEAHLKKQDKGADGPWLVGNKPSYADFAFITWQAAVPLVVGDKVDLSEFKLVNDWVERLNKIPAIKKVLEEAYRT